jgi:hypothetical protein
LAREHRILLESEAEMIHKLRAVIKDYQIELAKYRPDKNEYRVHNLRLRKKIGKLGVDYETSRERYVKTQGHVTRHLASARNSIDASVHSMERNPRNYFAKKSTQ